MRAPVFACLLALLAAACGGSSSETPPPLEPDPESGRYTGPRLPTKLDDARSAATAEPALEPEEEPAAPVRPGRSTWGTERKPAPSAPSLPGALPPRPSSSAAPVN